MNKMIKSLLMMALAVFVGTAFAADPVATWTDFSDNTLTSGGYTLTADASCTVHDDGSITLGGAGLSLPVGGDAITIVMDVSGVPTTKDITVASVKMGGQYVSLKSTGTQLVQSWNNGGNYGAFDWTPVKRQTIVLGTMQSKSYGTTTWIDGVQKVERKDLMTETGVLQNVYIGSYDGTTGSAEGMKVHSLRIYNVKLTDDQVAQEMVRHGLVEAVFDGSKLSAGELTLDSENTENTTLTVNEGATLNLSGSWGGDVVVYGTVKGTGTISGILKVGDYAVLDASNGALKAKEVWLVSGAPNARVFLPDNAAAGTVVVYCNNGRPSDLIGDLENKCEGFKFVSVDENGYKAIKIAAAQIGDTNYETLADAIAAAKSGDTVTLLGDCGISTGIILNKNITIDGGNFTLTAESGDGSLAQMVRVDSAATIKNITLAVNHKYDYGIQMYNPASDLTLENVTILYAGKAEGHKGGELLFGASVFLQQGNLLVKGKFTAFSGGETAGTFPFTGILYWPAGDIAPTFSFADGATASISDPTGATSDSDLLLVGAPGILPVEQADAMLSAFNIPAGFAPYTLALDCSIVQGVGGGFTGASPLAWNTIIDYGKKILTVVNESATETQVEVGILDDVEIPEVFVYEDANFSINGNGKELKGTIDFTDNVGTISNVKLTSDMTFVMTNVTEGCVKLGEDVIITSPVKVIPPANYGVGSAPLIEFTDGSRVKPGDFVIDQSALEIPEGTEFVVDGNKIVLGTPVAQIGEVKYASLLDAIAAAKSGDTVTLLGNVAGLVTLPEDVIISANGYTVQSVVDRDGHIVELHDGAYQVGKYPEQPPIRSIKIVGDKVQLSFVPRQTLKTVVVEASSDLKTWTAMDGVTYVNDGPGKECVISLAKPQGNNAFFRVKFEYAD